MLATTSCRWLVKATAIGMTFFSAVTLGATEADNGDALAAREILRRHCVRCHSGDGSEGGDFNVLDLESLLESGLVDKEVPEESLLLSRVVDGEMPPASIRAQQPVSQTEVDRLRSWIQAGAPDFGLERSRENVTIQSVMQSMIADLQSMPRDQRQFIRYFTLHHQHNSPSIMTQDLPIVRAALAKALNSLSWHPQIALPREVPLLGASASDTGLLYAIDIRRLRWDASVWREIEMAYPYGVSYRSSEQEELQMAAERVEELTPISVPLVRADWFVATATRGELYYKILDLPTNESELLAALCVDVQPAFSDPHIDLIARAGFSKSGVSAQNRLVERLVGKNGMYWRSFDFGPEAGRGKLTRFPLGPRTPASQFNRFAFVHDGGEIIFALPNGLHAYVLVDGNGDRIDVGPIHVVGDALKTAGTPAIVNAVSCFACHKHGLIDVADTLRDGSVVEGDALRHLRKLHPPRDAMDQVVQRDRDAYLVQLENVIGKYLRVGKDKDKSIDQFDEPIGHVARQHRLVFLDLDTVAAELDVSSDELLRIAGSRNLRRLGLESLTRDGLISRAEWEAKDQGISLMQQVARVLRLTPVSPL